MGTWLIMKGNRLRSKQFTDPATRALWEQFCRDREINVEFYRRVPEEKLDFRMVDTPQRKSDSPRESLVHLIDSTREYVNGVKTGEELFLLLSDPTIGNQKITVPWSKEPIPAVSALWGLDSQEILHTGWNLALIDHLGIERFPSLKAMWG